MNNPKDILLTEEEIYPFQDHGDYYMEGTINDVAALLKAQVCKVADWITECEEGNTHLHIGNLVNELREAANE